MGRPPCCDKDGIKKGPWTPEEDIILVSYIQQHGPGNWRSVPTNTGLQRCSKSCRLRWTNYLRPGIKRGNFTPHEEGMIVHLQALLGNKWAAIASYLPQRTDNDIKNYWNTHLKKKLNRFQSTLQQVVDPQQQAPATLSSSSSPPRKSINGVVVVDEYDHGSHHDMAATLPLQPSSTCYASSTENISRLLESWMKCSPSSKPASVLENTNHGSSDGVHDDHNNGCLSVEDDDDQFDTMLSFDDNSHGHHHNKVIDDMAAFATARDSNTNEGDAVNSMEDDDEHNPPLTFLEKWLLDESTTSRQVADEILRLPSIF